MDNWAEIRRLSKSEKLSQRAIARRLGIHRRTVQRALAIDKPLVYRRGVGSEKAGSVFDAYQERVVALLKADARIPASVIGERVNWPYSAGHLRAKVAELRPAFQVIDPSDRTVYDPGERVQCDLWFLGKNVPDSTGVLGSSLEGVDG